MRVGFVPHGLRASAWVVSSASRAGACALGAPRRYRTEGGRAKRRSLGMPDTPDWQLPAAVQPHGEDFAFDVDQALSAVVGLSARIPNDAFTASILGTERAGRAVAIAKDGLVLPIRYLVTHDETIWL